MITKIATHSGCVRYIKQYYSLLHSLAQHLAGNGKRIQAKVTKTFWHMWHFWSSFLLIFIKVSMLFAKKDSKQRLLRFYIQAREMSFPAVWGIAIFQNFLYAPRQLMVALRLDSLSGRITYFGQKILCPPNWNAPVRLWMHSFFLHQFCDSG